MIDTVGYFAGLPTRQLWQTVEYFTDWLTGEEEPQSVRGFLARPCYWQAEEIRRRHDTFIQRHGTTTSGTGSRTPTRTRSRFSQNRTYWSRSATRRGLRRPCPPSDRLCRHGDEVPSGGDVILVAGFLANGYAITIRRVRTATQTTDIRNQGRSSRRSTKTLLTIRLC